MPYILISSDKASAHAVVGGGSGGCVNESKSAILTCLRPLRNWTDLANVGAAPSGYLQANIVL
jgi:hypothetical protein